MQTLNVQNDLTCKFVKFTLMKKYKGCAMIHDPRDYDTNAGLLVNGVYYKGKIRKQGNKRNQTNQKHTCYSALARCKQDR